MFSYKLKLHFGMFQKSFVCVLRSYITFFFFFFLLQMRLLVAKEFLESVESIVTSQRPSWRAHAASVDTNRNSVLLMDDLTLFAHGNSKFVYSSFFFYIVLFYYKEIIFCELISCPWILIYGFLVL